MRFVPGAELSVSWRDVTLHVLALGIDPGMRAAARRGWRRSATAASHRARRIADSLAAAGIPGAYEGALQVRDQRALISRTHFARFLVETGHARDTKEVFKRYPGAGKPGLRRARVGDADRGDRLDPRRRRPGGPRASGALQGRLQARCANCSANSATPAATASKSCRPAHTPTQYAEYARHARVFGLLASCGSDYHGPGEGWVDLGDLPSLPAGVTPVWKDW